MESQGRLLPAAWDRYTADEVVFQPRHMTPDRLQELYHYAWGTFYADEPQTFKMYKLFQRVVAKEMDDQTYRPRRQTLAQKPFGERG
jgi:hypothetical protein